MATQSTPQHTPIRSTVAYTVGKADKRADTSTAATSPNIGTLRQTSRTASIIGQDYQTATVSYGALAAGATLTGSLTIPFKNILSPFQSFPQDVVFLDVDLDQLTNTTPGLALCSFQVIPQGISNGVSAPGPILTSGLQYTNFNAMVKYTYVAVSAVAAGSITVGVSGVLLYTAG